MNPAQVGLRALVRTWSHADFMLREAMLSAACRLAIMTRTDREVDFPDPAGHTCRYMIRRDEALTILLKAHQLKRGRRG